MTTISFKEAQQQLVPELKSKADWFIEGEAVHFIDPATLTAMAGAAIGLFLAGVVEGLRESIKAEGKAVGKSLGQRIIAALKVRVNKGLDAEPVEGEPQDGEQIAAEARQSVASVSSAQAIVVFEQIEMTMRSSFVELMPEDQAAEFSAQIRRNAVQVIYTQVL